MKLKKKNEKKIKAINTCMHSHEKAKERQTVL